MLSTLVMRNLIDRTVICNVGSTNTIGVVVILIIFQMQSHDPIQRSCNFISKTVSSCDIATLLRSSCVKGYDVSVGFLHSTATYCGLLQKRLLFHL